MVATSTAERNTKIQQDSKSEGKRSRRFRPALSGWMRCYAVASLPDA